MTLKGAQLAEKILAITTETTTEEIKATITEIDKAEATYGLLWGLDDIAKSGKDLDFYILKKKILQFVLELKEDKLYVAAYFLAEKIKQEEEVEQA